MGYKSTFYGRLFCFKPVERYKLKQHLIIFQRVRRFACSELLEGTPPAHICQQIRQKHPLSEPAVAASLFSALRLLDANSRYNLGYYQRYLESCQVDNLPLWMRLEKYFFASYQPPVDPPLDVLAPFANSNFSQYIRVAPAVDDFTCSIFPAPQPSDEHTLLNLKVVFPKEDSEALLQKLQAKVPYYAELHWQDGTYNLILKFYEVSFIELLSAEQLSRASVALLTACQLLTPIPANLHRTGELPALPDQEEQPRWSLPAEEHEEEVVPSVSPQEPEVQSVAVAEEIAPAPVVPVSVHRKSKFVARIQKRAPAEAPAKPQLAAVPETPAPALAETPAQVQVAMALPATADTAPALEGLQKEATGAAAEPRLQPDATGTVAEQGTQPDATGATPTKQLLPFNPSALRQAQGSVHRKTQGSPLPAEVSQKTEAPTHSTRQAANGQLTVILPSTSQPVQPKTQLAQAPEAPFQLAMSLPLSAQKEAPIEVANATLPVAPPTPRNLAAQRYVVRQGDSLSRIARNQFGDSTQWKAIWALNQQQVPNFNQIKPGQVLHLPAEMPQALPESTGAQHVVKPGDTLFALARRHYGDPRKWKEIWRLNKETIRSPRYLYPGQVLQLQLPPQQPVAPLPISQAVNRQSEGKTVPIPAVRPQPGSPSIVAQTVTEAQSAPNQPGTVLPQTPQSVPAQPPANQAAQPGTVLPETTLPVLPAPVQPDATQSVSDETDAAQLTQSPQQRPDTSTKPQKPETPPTQDPHQPTAPHQPGSPPGAEIPDWLLVAIGDAEVGQFNLGGNLQAVEQNDNFPTNFYVDGRVAYYLKGKVMGKALLTSSFDSAKSYQSKASSAVDPNRFYPIYGDSSTLVRDAQASGKLYLRLEALAPEDPKAETNRSNFLIGDYNAGLSGEGVNMGQYNRTFYGARAHVATNSTAAQKPLVSATVFAAPAPTIPSRDEYSATGLSHYKLSITKTRFLQQNPTQETPETQLSTSRVRPNFSNQLAQPLVIEGSERLTVLVRDKNQPDRILSTRTLSRGLDYDFDPFFGSVTLKTPVPTLDPNGNRNYLVVNYEYTNDPFFGLNPKAMTNLAGLGEHLKAAFEDTMQHNAFGARVESSLLDNTLTLGANYAQENQAPNNARLVSANTVWKPNERYQLSGEYAFTQAQAVPGQPGSTGSALQSPLSGFLSNDGGLSWTAINPLAAQQEVTGHAFRLELDASPFDWTNVRLFLRHTDPSFSSLFGHGEPGVRRWGANVEQQLNENFSLLGDFVQSDSFLRPDLTVAGNVDPSQASASNTLASVGVHWQNTPIELLKPIQNAPGGDISVRQEQTATQPPVNEKLQVSGGEPAISQESAKDVAPKPLQDESVTEKVPGARPSETQEFGLHSVGTMFADLRAEYNRSTSPTNLLQSGRLRSSFNYAPLERLLANIRGSLNFNHIVTTQTQETQNEVSGEVGLGASWALDKHLAVFTRVDFFNIGSTILQPSTTASVGLSGVVLDDETISMRPYAQYGINSSIAGRTNMIAIGLNNRWKITPWLTNNLNFEQNFNIQQDLKGLADTTSNSTAGSIGFEFLPTDTFKSSLKYEVRRQVGGGSPVPTVNPITQETTQAGAIPGSGTSLLDPTLNPAQNPTLTHPESVVATLAETELWQQTATLGVSGQIWQVSLFGNYFFNQFHTPSALRSRDLHFRTGFAYRPLDNDVLNIIGMHEFRNIHHPSLENVTNVEIPLELEANTNIFSVEGVWQILANLEFSQKYAVKLATATVLDTSIRNPAERSTQKTITNPEPVVTDLIISRLAYRPFYTQEFWERFDIAGEYRIMRQRPDSIFNAKSGFLTELGFLITPNVRLGVGYNFMNFDDANVKSNNYQAGNWFLRVTGKY